LFNYLFTDSSHKRILNKDSNRQPNRYNYRVRKENPSVDNGVIKPLLRKGRAPLKKETNKAAMTKDNLQKSLSTPSKFNPKSLKAMASKVLNKQNEQIITEKKFTKVCFLIV
jgi:hypothetical protein